MLQTARHLGRLLLIAALLAGGGAHWFVLQSVAWTTMLVANSRETSFVEAVKTTFDGSRPCALCRIVETGRKHQPRTDAHFALKIELFYEPSPRVLHPTIVPSWLDTPPLAALVRTSPPALPPPRLG